MQTTTADSEEDQELRGGGGGGREGGGERERLESPSGCKETSLASLSPAIRNRKTSHSLLLLLHGTTYERNKNSPQVLGSTLK